MAEYFPVSIGYIIIATLIMAYIHYRYHAQCRYKLYIFGVSLLARVRNLILTDVFQICDVCQLNLLDYNIQKLSVQLSHAGGAYLGRETQLEHVNAQSKMPLLSDI